jgi:hypothetical protein
MRRLSVSLAIVAVAVAITSCARERAAVADQPPVADSATVARAQLAANTLGPDLAGMLQQAIRDGGPIQAVAVCADSAQARTARHAIDGVAIRRVGTRVRNPANAPDTLEARVLGYLAEQKAAGTMPGEVIEVARTGLDGGWELRYIRPVVLQEFCTTCHGAVENIPPAVRSVIAERYPSDSAVGYAAGDLRGAITVRIPLAAQR